MTTWTSFRPAGTMIAGIQLADPRMRVEFEATAARGSMRVRVTG